MRKKLTALGLILLMLLAAGCSGEKGGASPAAEDRDAVTIQTACGDLLYPAEWEEHFTADVEETNFGAAVTFSSDCDGEQVILFTLNIGGGEGEAVGTLKDAEGTERTVNMVIDELMLEGADEETANRLFAMQEDVNFVIEHLD